MKKSTKLVGALLTAALTVAVFAACTTPSSTINDQRTTNSQLGRYQANQPVPQFDWSQYRQTLIDVNDAQVHTVVTTTFFFNMGTDNPIKECSSIGFPVPTTAQLTNPDQVAFGGNFNGNSGEYGVVGQQEPNGVYTGASSGTYVVCVGTAGQPYITYWEGDVQVEGGAAHWDKTQGLIVQDGTPTVPAKIKK